MLFCFLCPKLLFYNGKFEVSCQPCSTSEDLLSASLVGFGSGTGKSLAKKVGVKGQGLTSKENLFCSLCFSGCLPS
jgi:hypothetical protein